MKNYIRKVIRNLPETNSSSSHSVVICTDKTSLLDPNDNPLNMDDNGVITVPCYESFGWEWERTNSPMTKLQYLCGLLWDRDNPKKIKRLINVVLNFTGANKILFEWAENKKRDTSDLEDDYNNDGAPEIDHNSRDIVYEIAESNETIKDFIFNNNSWLFLGNDNSESPNGFYDVFEKENDIDAIISFEFGYNLGRVDIPISQFPSEISRDSGRSNSIVNELYCNCEDQLDDLVFDKSTNTYIYKSEYDSDFYKSNIMTIVDYEASLNVFPGNITFCDPNLVRKIREDISNALSNIIIDDRKERRNIYNQIYRDNLLANKDNIILIPFHIKSIEFGDIL